MSIQDTQTLFGRALTSHPPQAIEVAMDRARIVFFTQTLGIGTRNLNSCTVAVIVSQHAAIMAHIAPNSFTGAASGDLNAGLVHVQQVTNLALSLLDHYQDYFPPQSTSCIISASPDYGVYVPLDHQRDQIASMLRQRSLTVSSTTYHIPVSEVPGPAKGMVFLTKQPGRPTLYIADQIRANW